MSPDPKKLLVVANRSLETAMIYPEAAYVFWFLTYESGSKTLLVIANTGFLS